MSAKGVNRVFFVGREMERECQGWGGGAGECCKPGRSATGTGGVLQAGGDGQLSTEFENITFYCG